MRGKLKQAKGITLIALVITIIVLLILAGVSIAMLTGQNGILTQANNAKIEQSHGSVREGIALAYNEYQIEINTASNIKLASTEQVQIQGKEEKALASYSSFLDFLSQKGYADSSTGIINVEALTGSRQSLGNGTGSSDVYKIEENGGNYEVNYYDINETPQQIWSVEGKIELEADTGKEALILVYEVSAGDTIELPYNTQIDNPTYNFQVDWGDNTEISTGITNSNIAQEAIHTYQNAGKYEIKITGRYEVIDAYKVVYPKGIDKLVEVKQWGTTGLKNVDLSNCCYRLTKIATPTKGSFENLTYVTFEHSNLEAIPDKLFMDCKNIKSFVRCFFSCDNLTEIGDYIFKGCENVESFEETFYGSRINTIPENLFQDCVNVISFEDTFCESEIGSIPKGLFDNCTKVEDFSYTFAYTNITSIPEDLFENCKNVQTLVGTFKLTPITSIPENLFANCDWNKVQSLANCFANCENLEGSAPELWLKGTNSEENNYQGIPDGLACFTGCVNLDNYDEIPEYWKMELA